MNRPVPYVVSARRHIPAEARDGFDEYVHVKVLATSEDEAIVVAGHLDTWPLGLGEYAEFGWAEKAVPTHAHRSIHTQDCDGRYSYYTTIDLPELTEHGKWRTPRERLGVLVAKYITGNLMFGLDFSITMNGDAIVVEEPGDEGGTSTAFAVCDDDFCEEYGTSSQRDHSAEAMGY